MTPTEIVVHHKASSSAQFSQPPVVAAHSEMRMWATSELHPIQSTFTQFINEWPLECSSLSC